MTARAYRLTTTVAGEPVTEVVNADGYRAFDAVVLFDRVDEPGFLAIGIMPGLRIELVTPPRAVRRAKR